MTNTIPPETTPTWSDVIDGTAIGSTYEVADGPDTIEVTALWSDTEGIVADIAGLCLDRATWAALRDTIDRLFDLTPPAAAPHTTKETSTA